MVLLTKAPLLVREGSPLEPPPLHLLCIIESIDDDEKHRGQKTVTGHLNLQSGSTGFASPPEDVLGFGVQISNQVVASHH